MPDKYSHAENEHPGIILLEEFLEPLGISQNQLAVAMNVPRTRINQIVKGKRSVTAETSMRLGRALGLSDFFFLNLQIQYEKMGAMEQFNEAINIQPIVSATG
jgi:addiction module HigA family antidote